MLLAAGLLVSVPSWAYVPGEEKNFGQYNFPLVPPDVHGEFFGTLCFPERIVAIQGIKIWDVFCVDVFRHDSTKVARLVVLEHTVCYGYGQTYYDGHQWYESYEEPFCPEGQGTGANSCEEKVYIDWASSYDEETTYDYRMKAGAAYFYQVCDNGADSLKDRKIWLDKSDVASAPVCQNGFYGTFTDTKVNEPVTLLTMVWSEAEGKYIQQLEQVTSATIPAHRGYFKGNFECVPWRWNTDARAEDNPYPSSAPNPLHYPCTGEVKEAPRRLSTNAVAFNVGPRDAATGLYPIDLEHPIYLGQETNKRIENGQLIIETSDGTKYNAFGQKLKVGSKN